MQSSLLVNNMYAAYSANSLNVNGKSVSELSKMVGARRSEEQDLADDKEYSMDKVIISKEALAMLKEMRIQQEQTAI